MQLPERPPTILIAALGGEGGGVLSKWLVEGVMAYPTLRGLRRVLLGTRDAHGLYGRYGFTPLADPGRYLEVFRPDVYRDGSSPNTCSEGACRW